MRFLDVKTDLAFKKVFGSTESKPILISFLNAILYTDQNKKIEDLTIVDPYAIPLLKGMKDSYVDVKAVLNDGTQVIVEMQVLNHAGFEQRILINAAKHYALQLKKGQTYSLINPVIALTIADFTMFKEEELKDSVLTRFKLLEQQHFIKYSDDIELVFVELPKFNKPFEALETISDQWIYFLKHAGEMEMIPKTFDPCLSEALSFIDESNMSEAELEEQYKRKEFIYIQKSSLELAKQQGLKKGIKEGLEKGIKEGLEKGIKEGLEKGRKEGEIKANEETAIKLLALEMSPEIVAKTTGLSLEHVTQLQDKS